MCRLLCVKAHEPVDIGRYLEKLAGIASNSKEYQGHGWGCGYLVAGRWQFYRNINPIWEDDLGRFGRSNLLLAHARSAFRDENISVENNMPFFDGRYGFIFNGELRGVKISEKGRIGAEKVFNYIKRFDKGDMSIALRRAMDIIAKRTRYVRAMNVVIADEERIYLGSMFNEDPEYFTLRYKRTPEAFVLSSEPFPYESGWEAIPNRSVEALP